MKSFKVFFPVLFFIPFLLFSEFITFQSLVKKVEGSDRNSVSDFLKLLTNFVGNTKYNQSAEEFHRFLQKALEKFEFKDLYDSKYMKSSANGYKSVVYVGLNKNDGYEINLIDSSFDKIQSKKLGDFGAEFALKRNEKSSVVTKSYPNTSSYSGVLKLDQNFGVFSHEKGTVLLSSILSILDKENLNKINLEPSKSFPKLVDSKSRKLLDLISDELPILNKFLVKFFFIDSLIQEVQTEKSSTLVHLKGRINNRFVQNQYPYLASYLDDISELGVIYISLFNTSGSKVFDLKLESSNLLLECKLYTNSGKIIPFQFKNNKDELDFANAINVQDIKSYPFKIHISFRAEIYGLKFENKNIDVSGNYIRKNGEGNIQFTLKEVHKTKVSGGFSYLIPSWAIDLVIPGNMEELIEHFTNVLVQANQKNGSYLNLIWKKKSTHWQFSVRSETEFADNFFIRFGLKVFNFKIRPSKEASDELSKFLTEIFESIRTDIEKTKN